MPYKAETKSNNKMKNLFYLVTQNNQSKLYNSMNVVCKEFGIVKSTVYAQFERQGYYDRNGLRIERKELNK